jgi:hypothetical protein
MQQLDQHLQLNKMTPDKCNNVEGFLLRVRSHVGIHTARVLIHWKCAPNQIVFVLGPDQRNECRWPSRDTPGSWERTQKPRP